jgi:hypothetical protein
VYCILCWPHGDQILPQLTAPHRRLTWPAFSMCAKHGLDSRLVVSSLSQRRPPQWRQTAKTKTQNYWSRAHKGLDSKTCIVDRLNESRFRRIRLKANPHIPSRVHASPLPCSDSAVVPCGSQRGSQKKIRTANPAVQRNLLWSLLLPPLTVVNKDTCGEHVIIACGLYLLFVGRYSAVGIATR